MNLQAPCFTLDQYIEEDNFTAGSTFVFLAGNHTPHHQMNLTDIGHVTLRGEDKDSIPSNLHLKEAYMVKIKSMISMQYTK